MAPDLVHLFSNIAQKCVHLHMISQMEIVQFHTIIVTDFISSFIILWFSFFFPACVSVFSWIFGHNCEYLYRLYNKYTIPTRPTLVGDDETSSPYLTHRTSPVIYQCEPYRPRLTR